MEMILMKLYLLHKDNKILSLGSFPSRVWFLLTNPGAFRGGQPVLWA